MRFTGITLTAALAATLVACSQQQAQTPPPVAPAITQFSADKTQVFAGQQVKLSFTVERAKELSLIDETGTTIMTSGDASKGEATVNPTHSSFYVLRATGDGGKDAAFVQVAVSEGLKNLFLVTIPAQIDSGGEVTVAWSAIGGSNVSLKDASGAVISNEASGAKTLTPARSTDFDLRATGLAGTLTAKASLTVRPVIKSFTANPVAARPGEKLTLGWKTAGAETLELKETTFGSLLMVTSAAQVDDGSFEVTVPQSFANDAGVPDNYPLHFTLDAKTATPPQTVTRSLDTFARAGPAIATFTAPAFVSETKPMSISWTLTGATRSELALDGRLVTAATGSSGSYVHPSIGADVQLTLTAYDFNGLKVSQTKTVKVAKAPKVNTFTLPGTVASGAANAAAVWTTSNASLVLVRAKGGPAELVTTTMLATGSAMLHPGRTTTYVLEAYNDAGDRDALEKTVTVTTPLTASATPNPTSPNSLVNLAWDIGAQNPADVVGLPAEPPVSNAASTNFFEIDGLPKTTKLPFAASANDATLSFSTGFGFSFPVVGQGVSTFAASTNGFLALQSTTSTLATNADLKASSGLPAFSMLAPLWDDLELGPDGAIEWLIDGTTFPRRLIVQWNKVRVAGDAMSELTFQVQLYETGEFRYEYQTLVDTMGRALGSSATVGVWLAPSVFAGQHGYNTGSVAEGLELVWFTNGLSLGARSVVTGTQSFTPAFFYKTTGGAWVWVGIPIRVFGSGSVLINEVMPQPASGVAEGQYLELFNPGSLDLDVSGLELSTVSSPAATFVVPPNTTLTRGGYLVLGQSTTAANNGGAPVDVGYGTSLAMTPADTAEVKVIGALLVDGGTADPFTVSSYAWGASTAGTAVQRDPALGGGLPVCTLTQTYGTAGSLGTPGKVNESCFPYTVTTIPAAFEDVSDGMPLFPAGLWDLNGTRVPLTMPFKYFGVDATSLWVCTNGWLSTKPTESSTADTNKTAPGSGSPIGAIAPFWDDLTYSSQVPSAQSNGFTRRMTDHQVVQWSKAAIYSERTTTLLDFEAKLFDNGNIEFHYGDLVGASLLQQGGSATVWLEAPDGGAALPVSINQPTVMPNTALRFTPKP